MVSTGKKQGRSQIYKVLLKARESELEKGDTTAWANVLGGIAWITGPN